MATKRDHLTKAGTVTLAVIEQNVPMLADASRILSIRSRLTMIWRPDASGVAPPQ